MPNYYGVIVNLYKTKMQKNNFFLLRFMHTNHRIVTVAVPMYNINFQKWPTWCTTLTVLWVRLFWFYAMQFQISPKLLSNAHQTPYCECGSFNFIDKFPNWFEKCPSNTVLWVRQFSMFTSVSNEYSKVHVKHRIVNAAISLVSQKIPKFQRNAIATKFYFYLHQILLNSMLNGSERDHMLGYQTKID